MTQLLAVLLACGRPTVSGQVVDVTGAPIATATIAAPGTLCTAETGADGRFTMPCGDDDLELVIVQDGWYSHELSVWAGARERQVGRVVLYRIPSEDGLFLFEGAAYRTLEAGAVQRRDSADGNLRRYCIDREHSKANTVPAGPLRLFDQNADDWRLFRADDASCVYREAYREDQERFAETHAAQPAHEVVEIETGKRVVTAQLDAGEYFVADWRHGGFERKGESELFRGHLIVVQ